MPIRSEKSTMCAVGLQSRIAQSVYDFLDLGKSPRPADCIFVLAGSLERKTYGIKMWRFGYAAQLILSIGNLEWRNFGELGLEADGGLTAQAEKMPAKRRHFLVRLDRQDVFCTEVPKGLLATRSEARQLAKYMRSLSVRSLIVVSSPAHLRRASLVFRRAFRKTGIHVTFVAVPEKLSFSSSSVRCDIWLEFGKYLLYRIIPF